MDAGIHDAASHGGADAGCALNRCGQCADAACLLGDDLFPLAVAGGDCILQIAQLLLAALQFVDGHRADGRQVVDPVDGPAQLLHPGCPQLVLVGIVLLQLGQLNPGLLRLQLFPQGFHPRQYLAGFHAMDEHFATAPFEENVPVTLGLLSVWNVSFLDCPARAILPYTQALAKLAPHIQQVAMESNGKGVSIDGQPLPYDTGEIDFGEPGTNGQHSFYQLIHQGRTIPCDFIGIIKSQQSVYLKGEIVSNHDELMCNFFAQADALAVGKTAVQLRSENCPDSLIPHKTFTGNRPSLSIMLPALNAYTTGQILAIYEHRVATQGFIWGLNSFDQWGVQLGKRIAGEISERIDANAADFDASTQGLLELVRAHFPSSARKADSAEPASSDKKPARKKR